MSLSDEIHGPLKVSLPASFVSKVREVALSFIGLPVPVFNIPGSGNEWIVILGAVSSAVVNPFVVL